MDVKKDILWRVYISFIVMMILCFVVIGRAFYVQQYQGHKWKNMNDSLHVRNEEVLASRGTIYSEDGKMLSTSIPEFDVFIDFRSESLRDKKGKKFFENIDSLSIGLSNIFQDHTSAVYKKLLKQEYAKKTPYYSLQKHISYQDYKLLKALPLVRLGRSASGFVIETKSKRYNPYNQLAFRTIGLARDSFKVGLELSYDSILKGKSGNRTVRYIAGGVAIPLDESHEAETENGKDIVTTIDVFMQEITESALYNMMRQNDAQHGCAIVMETKTGKIKAIANLGYDEATAAYVENKNYSLYAAEPGSTIKLATMIALLDDGKITENTLVDLEKGVWKFSKDVIVKDAEEHSKNFVTAKEAFESSSNVGMAKMVWNNYNKQPRKFVDKIVQLRMDSLTGIDLVGERKPTVHKPNTKNWNYSTLMWMSFGYSISVNPLQTLTLYNAIANNGVMVKPYLVNEIKSEGATFKTFSPTVLQSKICNDNTLKVIKNCLEGVCKFPSGTAKKLFLNNPYMVAGKTGTNNVSEGSAGYSKDIFQSSFVGYFPANNPQYSCIVVIENKKQSRLHLGADVAGPVFKEIADKLYSSYVKNKVGDNQGRFSKRDSSSFLINAYKDDIQYLTKKIGLSVSTTATIEDDWVSLTGKAKVGIANPKKMNAIYMPSLNGMNAKDAIYICENMGLKVDLTGAGKIISQSIAIGQRIKIGDNIILKFN